MFLKNKGLKGLDERSICSELIEKEIEEKRARPLEDLTEEELLFRTIS